MSVFSNPYAERVFSEHPIGLWPLDEKSDYIDFLSKKNRNLQNSDIWHISSGSIQKVLNAKGLPIGEDSCFRIFGSDTFSIELFAEDVTDLYFNPELKTLSLGFHLLAETQNIQSVKFGFFFDPPGQPFFENSDSSKIILDIKDYENWHFYGHTFDLFEEDFVELDAIFSPTGLPANFVKESHGFSEGDQILLTSTNRLPQNILENTKYFVRYVDENSFNVSLSPNGPAIESLAVGRGRHTAILIKSVGIKITLLLTDDKDFSALFNGLTLGQWSEEFQEKSLGIKVEPIKNIAIRDGFFGIPVEPYGLIGPNGYFLSKNNKLLAKNNNIPMIFGSNNLTSLYPHPQNQPSAIFPGLGFLNESGKYRTHTVEFWMRINCDISYPFRIFGPIASSDGLYLENAFLILKIGNYYKSHYVGDLYRPMLVNIISAPGIMSLTINGEKIFDLPYTFEEIDFPDTLDGSGREQDWLGFYSDDNILSFDIDCFAIYPYRVATSIAKRRFVLGQAVELPENLISLYDGESFLSEFSFSNYGTTYSYPDIGSWNVGYLDNMLSENNTLSPPKYSLPSFVFSNKSFQDWDNDLKQNSRGYVSLKPSEAWEETDGYIFFENINLARQGVKSFYGIFEPKIDFDGEETLFRLENLTTEHFVEAVLESKVGDVLEFDHKKDLIFVKPSHGLQTGDLISFLNNESVLPTKMIPNKEYRVNRIDKNSFSLSDSIATPTISTWEKIDQIDFANFPTTFFAKSHGLKDNEKIVFSSTKKLPSGIVGGREYYARAVDENRFKVSINPISNNFEADDFVKLFSAGQGTQRFRRVAQGKIEFKTNVISYYLSQNTKRKIFESRGISLGHDFVAGINIESFSNFFGTQASSFLKNIRQLRVYFGGSRDFSKTFSGKIHRIGFSTQKNSLKTRFMFDNNGVPFFEYQFDGNGVIFPESFGEVDGGNSYTRFVDDALSVVASYTLLVQNELDLPQLEIAVSSSWQDYIPLSYFEKKTLGRDGKRSQSLAFIQFNSDYPAPEVYSESCCNTSNSSIKTYVSFQPIKGGANKSSNQFARTLNAPKDNVVIPDQSWPSTRYEVVNGSIIYLPPRVKVSDLAIVVDVEIDSPGIILRPIKLKSMSLSGRALNQVSPNPLGSRSGYSAFPYVRYGIYLDHDDFNPFSFYRDNTPHLYLTKNSGIKVEGEFSQSYNRGIEFLINPKQNNDFVLSAINLFMRFDNEEKLVNDIQLFEIEYGKKFYRVMAKSLDPENRRVQLYSTNRSGDVVSDLGFYLNGSFTTQPTISLREWNSLGIGFANPADLSSSLGYFRVTGPVLFNNFSHYALTGVQKTKIVPGTPPKKNFVESEYFGPSLSEIYAIYTGTNSIVIKDSIVLRPKNYKYSVFAGNSLQTSTYIPL
jgi:hypothetical protein